MVLIVQTNGFVNPKIAFMNSSAPKAMILSQEPPQQDPDPVLQKIQQPTSVEDLGDKPSNSEISGQGFLVKGAGSRPKNDRLRKFISLKLN